LHGICKIQFGFDGNKDYQFQVDLNT
jgi:hypothetical protein